MVNAHRGEISACLNGTQRTLVLTLGALAELESAFGDQDMVALASRFENGRLSSGDCVKIIAAGLRGAGAAVTDDEVSQMRADGGVAGFIDIVARLLAATFAGEESTTACQIEGGEASGLARRPFPGAT